MIRSRLTYANVMATIAVFLALGGGAYAVSLKRNSVGPKQLKTDAVTGIDAQESTFSQVPSAATADSAVNATSAATATGAGLLDGLDSIEFQRQVDRVDTTESATPSVAGVSLLQLFYSSNTVLTDLPGGVNGQIVVLTTPMNNNVDIMDTGNFDLAGNFLMVAQDTLTLIRSNGVWIELSRSIND